MSRAKPPFGAAPVAFELRRRRRRPHRTDTIHFKCGPELKARLDQLESELIAKVTAEDPRFEEFRKWYEEEARFYGIPIGEGVAALYWWWTRPEAGSLVRLDAESFEELRLRLGEMLRAEVLDGSMLPGRAIVAEFIWRAASDIVFQPHLMVAINEFREYEAAGRMKPWWRRRRRRLAAAERRLSKSTYDLPAGQPTDA